MLEPLHERYGTDISDAAMRKAVEKHNEICRIISEMGEMRKAENPVITGAEFHKIVLATYVCPKDLILDKLYETLEELKHREPDKKSKFRARVVIVGGEIDDPDMIHWWKTAVLMLPQTGSVMDRSRAAGNCIK